MKRRSFIKTLPVIPLVPAGVLFDQQQTQGGALTQVEDVPAAVEVPEFAEHVLDSDMQGLGPDGKPTGQTATFTGASRASASVEQAATHQMELTAEEQALLNGEKGEEITPDGGFVGYGVIDGEYLLLIGSVPGPKKRGIALRKAIRPPKVMPSVSIDYISTKSQQGT